MGKLKYLIIHCTDTPKNREVSLSDLTIWHKGPRRLNDGTIRYLGKTYPDIQTTPLLPEHVHANTICWGRGWNRFGYSDLIHLDGTIENITKYDDDNIVEYDEMTWGASGVNDISRHVCVVGGRTKKNVPIWGNFDQLINDAQFVSLTGYCKQFIKDNPTCMIGGHYQFTDKKKCPGFDVPHYLQFIDIPDKNIFSGTYHKKL